MKRIRLELSLDLLRQVNAERRRLAVQEWPDVRDVIRASQDLRLAEMLLEQHDADARARADVRQSSIFEVLSKRQA